MKPSEKTPGSSKRNRSISIFSESHILENDFLVALDIDHLTDTTETYLYDEHAADTDARGPRRLFRPTAVSAEELWRHFSGVKGAEIDLKKSLGEEYLRQPAEVYVGGRLRMDPSGGAG